MSGSIPRSRSACAVPGPTTAICGPYDDVRIPRGSEKTDWEVELGVVIGDVARDVSEAAAMDHVAGYVLVHDVSERAFQLDAPSSVVRPTA